MCGNTINGNDSCVHAIVSRKHDQLHIMSNGEIIIYVLLFDQ